MRLPGWEKRLKAVIEKHMALPSEYGISDCYIIPDDVVEAMTGNQMFEDVRDYTNEIGAAKKLKQHGFDNVEDAFASKFERIKPVFAQRGDIGVTESNGVICGGAFTALGFMTRNDNCVVFLPVSRVKSAFKIGR